MYKRQVIIYTDILIIGSTLLVGYGLSDVVYGYIVTAVSYTHLVNKYKTISYGRIVMTVDSMIILSSLFVGDMGVDSVIYGFVVTAVLGYTVDVIQAGNQQSRQIFVFTRRYEAMADQIIATTRHSATILDATGWYSKEEMCIRDRRTGAAPAARAAP